MNNCKVYWYFSFIIIFIIVNIQEIYADEIIGIENDVHILSSSSETLLLSKQDGNKLEIFCYKGERHTFTSILKTIELVVKIPNNNFHYYEGNNASAVRHQYAESSWLSFTPWRPNSFRLSIYNFSCIGIETLEQYKVFLNIRYIDLWRVLTLVVGVSLFLMAPLLAQNVLFHYATGISIGVFGSLLVIIFMFSKMVPKKAGALSFLIGGWGLVLYLVQYIWTNSIILMKEYQTAIAGYILLSGILSFAAVYRWGPIKDQRSLHLVQWSLQLMSLIAIFFSSQYREFTLSFVIVLLAQYNIPSSWTFKFRTYWLRKFPPKQTLLSDGEYLEQSRAETKKALSNLREFCHSPDCNAWKTMSTLTSPQRFAEFVEGRSHLNDNEIMAYESYNSFVEDQSQEELMTSDEDDC